MILNEASKPHETESQNIHTKKIKGISSEKTFRYSKKFPSHMILIHRTFKLKMKCISCKKTFRYVLNEASKPHETESFYFLDPKKVILYFTCFRHLKKGIFNFTFFRPPQKGIFC